MITLLSFCSFPWWLAWLLPFLLGFLLGWGLWSRWKNKYDSIYTDLQNDRSRINALEVDNDKLRDSISAIEENKKRLKLKLKESEDMLEASRLRLNTSINRADYDAMKKDLDIWKGRHQEMTDARDNYTSIVSTLEKEYINLQGSNPVTGAEEEAIDWETRFHEVNKTLEIALDDLEKTKKENTDLKDSNTSLSEERILDDEFKNLQDKYAHLETNIQDLLKINSTWESEFETLKAKYDALVAEDWKGKYEERNDMLARVKDQVEDLQLKYKDFDSVLSDKDQEIAALKSRYEAGDTKQSTGVRGIYDAIDLSNLQFIEGIGPAMESVLKDNGIKSLGDLGNSNTESIQSILDSYGDKYRIIDPTTWVQQAGLASAGKWGELIALQKELDGGVASGTISPSKAEKMMIKLGILKEYKQDDLTAIEGIGPATNRLLNASGINTWRELADSTTSQLQSILDDAGSKFQLVDPETWVKQATLAAEGRFDELREYQDYLDGGKERS